MITANEKLLLELIKIALGKSTTCALPNSIKWDTLFNLSIKQGVPSIVMDGLDRCIMSLPVQERNKEKLNNTTKHKWLGKVFGIERQYYKNKIIIEDLAAFYKKCGYHMMLLKGFGLSLYWPTPNHRPTGDIDIYLIDANSDDKVKNQHVWKLADKKMEEAFGIQVDCSHHHHSVFKYKGAMVENHFDFVNVNSHHSNKWIENEFKRLASQGYEEYKLENDIKLLFPSPLFNCLFVARHNAIHFAAEHINLRQLLDWALFVESRHEEIEWGYFWKTCKKMGMEKFVLCMVIIAIEQLSFEKRIFHIPDEHIIFLKHNEDLVENVFDNILHPTDNRYNGKGLKYIFNRYKLWKSNLWKHDIVYSDGVISTFFTQVKSHLMKPATIFGI